MIKLHPAPKTKKLKKTENKVALRSAPQKKKKNWRSDHKAAKVFVKGIEFTKATSLLKNSALCSVLFFWSIYQWLLL